MNAAGTLQDYLDTVSRAVMTDDFDLYARHVSLPFQLATETTTLIVQDIAQLEQGFDAFVAMVQSQRTTDYIRLAESAAELHAGLITGRYVTHMLSGGTRIVPPFQSQVVLRLEDGVWRALSIANSMKNARWPVHVPQVDGGA